jgi:plasmid stabilization system protein ParE
VAEYTLSPRAEEDLREIWRAIAPDNELAADALLRRILEKTELAAAHPQMGARRTNLSPTARILIEGRYVVIYEPKHDGVFVVAVVYGPRDIEHWLD